MYIIYANSVDIKDLPEVMLRTVKHHQECGDLDGLIRIKDDVIERVVSYGFEMFSMLSFWGTPEEV